MGLDNVELDEAYSKLGKVSFLRVNIISSTIVETNDFKVFLETPAIRHVLDKVWAMLRSFNAGATEEAIKDLWILHWNNELGISNNSCEPHSMCVACGMDRDLIYSLHQVQKVCPLDYDDGHDIHWFENYRGHCYPISSEKEIGFMGSFCFSKFKLLLDFNLTLKWIIEKSSSEHWLDQLDEILDEIFYSAAKKYDKKFIDFLDDLQNDLICKSFLTVL